MMLFIATRATLSGTLMWPRMIGLFLGNFGEASSRKLAFFEPLFKRATEILERYVNDILPTAPTHDHALVFRVATAATE